jgi:hypothetical protein
MVMKMASGGEFHLRQDAEKSFWTLPISNDDGSGLQYVFWKRVWALRVFSMNGLNRRKSDVRRWTRRSHPLVA